MDSVVLSGFKTRPLEYIRLLRHWRILDTGSVYSMQNLPKDSEEYLSALCNVRCFKLANTRIEHIKTEKNFAVISQDSMKPSPISQSNFLPRHRRVCDSCQLLTTLQLSSFALKADEGRVPLLSRLLRENTRLRNVQFNCAGFFN